MPKVIALVLVVAVLVATSFMLFGGLSPDATFGKTSFDAPSARIFKVESPDSLRGLASEPGTLRAVVEQKPGLGEQKPGLDDVSASPVISEVEHIGPLEGEDMEAAMRLCQQFRQIQYRALEDGANTDDSGSLLREASRLCSAQRADAAIEALASGSYIVTAQGAKSAYSSPAIDILRFGSMRNGEPVDINIVLPLDGHPELKAAHDYLDAMRRFDGTEKARKFNELPLSERSTLIDKIRSIRSGSPTQDEMRWIRDTIGWGTRFDGSSRTLIKVQPRR